MTSSQRSTAIDDPDALPATDDASGHPASVGSTRDRVDGTRRRLLGGAAATSLLSALPVDAFAADPGAGKAGGTTPRNVRFTHGVASGDPLADRVILWTRVIPQGVGAGEFQADRPGRLLPDLPVRWEIADDASFSHVVSSGEALAVRSNDYCVKVDAQGLKPATRYWYRFTSGSAASPVGRTKTLPVGDVQQVRLAVFSCANYAAGYFNVYAAAVRRIEADPDHYDALLHLGDYIYEGSSDYPANRHAKTLAREVDPAHEAVKLVDYRRRYAQCRSDGHLQRLHELAPMIAVWDDHEFANDAWHDGAENHQDDEGTFKRRRNAAARAWREWLPVRDAGSHLACYRGFDFGQLLSLNMLDTRLQRRRKKLALDSFMTASGFDTQTFHNTLHHQDRDILGTAQRIWLSDRMKASRATWQMLGQQVRMARMHVPLPLMLEWLAPGSGLSPSAYAELVAKASTKAQPLTLRERQLLALPAVPYNLDAWDGYPDSRERLLDDVLRHGENLVVLAGDTHNAWASDLLDRQGRHIGVEFATPSVTSPGLEVTLAAHPPDLVARVFQQLVGSLKFAETERRGYLEITATPTECRGDWILIDTAVQRYFSDAVARSLRVLPGPENRRLLDV